jgi:hypothetical protein
VEIEKENENQPNMQSQIEEVVIGTIITKDIKHNLRRRDERKQRKVEIEKVMKISQMGKIKSK